MATEVIMPKVDMVMDEGTFVEWLKQEGDHVEKGEPLFVILTDKANIEIEAPASGILAGLRARPDDVIPVTEVIAYILEPGETLPAEAEARPTAPTEAVPAAEPKVPAVPRPGDGKVRATPVARRLAAELGLDLTQVAGRGPQGRIHKADVLHFAERRQKVSPPPAAVAPAPHVALPEARRREVVPLAGPRRIIAERMAYSASTAPHIALSLRVDMSEATRLRDRLLEPLQQKTGHRLSFTAIIARAVAAVLPQHPYLNSSLHGEEIILWEDVHLGVATSVEDVLIVPVIREAQRKNLEQIVAALGDLTERARARKLTPAEMTGSTFTVTNLGMFGVESFTAIINPPEAAILAVGEIVDTPVGVAGEIVLRPLLNLTLSADHRLVDGVTAARFLADLKTTLENPYLLI
ncbi:MAG: dihydrolipoamide acetyltransferase family protein [Anaerolineae bacterium]|nr:dihydrolipoamide acetyltransferase family protein [Anaerolineae bacterium]